jgi:hypothetical protein
MLLKIVILILFVAVIISLTGGLIFLLKDMNVPESKRALYALGIRIALAATLMATIAYGIQTGQLKNKAPWDNLPKAQSETR